MLGSWVQIHAVWINNDFANTLKTSQNMCTCHIHSDISSPHWHKKVKNPKLMPTQIHCTYTQEFYIQIHGHEHTIRQTESVPESWDWKQCFRSHWLQISIVFFNKSPRPCKCHIFKNINIISPFIFLLLTSSLIFMWVLLKGKVYVLWICRLQNTCSSKLSAKHVTHVLIQLRENMLFCFYYSTYGNRSGPASLLQCSTL